MLQQAVRAQQGHQVQGGQHGMQRQLAAPARPRPLEQVSALGHRVGQVVPSERQQKGLARDGIRPLQYLREERLQNVAGRDAADAPLLRRRPRAHHGRGRRWRRRWRSGRLERLPVHGTTAATTAATAIPAVLLPGQGALQQERFVQPSSSSSRISSSASSSLRRIVAASSRATLYLDSIW